MSGRISISSWSIIAGAVEGPKDLATIPPAATTSVCCSATNDQMSSTAYRASTCTTHAAPTPSLPPVLRGSATKNAQQLRAAQHEKHLQEQLAVELWGEAIPAKDAYHQFVMVQRELRKSHWSNTEQIEAIRSIKNAALADAIGLRWLHRSLIALRKTTLSTTQQADLICDITQLMLDISGTQRVRARHATIFTALSIRRWNTDDQINLSSLVSLMKYEREADAFAQALALGNLFGEMKGWTPQAEAQLLLAMLYKNSQPASTSVELRKVIHTMREHGWLPPAQCEVLVALASRLTEGAASLMALRECIGALRCSGIHNEHQQEIIRTVVIGPYAAQDPAVTFRRLTKRAREEKKLGRSAEEISRLCLASARR